jgi:hypothetical protein
LNVERLIARGLGGTARESRVEKDSDVVGGIASTPAADSAVAACVLNGVATVNASEALDHSASKRVWRRSGGRVDGVVGEACVRRRDQRVDRQALGLAVRVVAGGVLSVLAE